MNNLQIYNAVREVPAEAQKPISGGRLRGMTDINPMWRIKALTEQFGPCGVGWKYEIVEERLAPGAGDEVAAFVKINLFIKQDGAWSDAIPGSGGSMFVAKEKDGLRTNDEAFKMALTDAISVACKALGFGANVYWQKDRTKYSDEEETKKEPKKEQKKEVQDPSELGIPHVQRINQTHARALLDLADGKTEIVKAAMKGLGIENSSDIPVSRLKEMEAAIERLVNRPA